MEDSISPETGKDPASTTMRRPLVAIVGRPNVGKSTLFNRVVGRPLAIVEDIPGTTRDRLYAKIKWLDKEFELIDTGGLVPGPEGEIGQKVREQVEVSVAEADLVLFLVDVTTGIVPADLELADTLRRSGKPLLLVVNKVDNEVRRSESTVFYELGMGDPIPISAYHGTGISDLLDTVAEMLPSAPPEAEAVQMPKIAIIGRPNVGKSLLLNALLGQERVIVSEVPGTTRDAIDTIFYHEDRPVLLIDTAGIRRRGKIEAGVERYSVLRATRALDRADIALLVFDASEGLTAQDTHIAGQTWEAYKGMIVVANKWDLIKEQVYPRSFDANIRQDLKFAPHVPIIHTSARYGEGVDKLLPTAIRIFEERFKRVPTSLLNDVINQAVLVNNPPPMKGRRLNILYATQAEVNPPTIIFFVNDRSLLHFSYKRYLENRLREAFGFDGTPIKMVFKRRGESTKA